MCIIRPAQIAEAMQAEGKSFLKVLFKFNQQCVDKLIKIVNNLGLRLGGIAQLGERLHGMQEVSGSIPLTSTKAQSFRSPSSRGLGHRPFTAVTPVRIRLGMPVTAKGSGSKKLESLLFYFPLRFVWVTKPVQKGLP